MSGPSLRPIHHHESLHKALFLWGGCIWGGLGRLDSQDLVVPPPASYPPESSETPPHLLSHLTRRSSAEGFSQEVFALQMSDESRCHKMFVKDFPNSKFYMQKNNQQILTHKGSTNIPIETTLTNWRNPASPRDDTCYIIFRVEFLM